MGWRLRGVTVGWCCVILMSTAGMNQVGSTGALPAPSDPPAASVTQPEWQPPVRAEAARRASSTSVSSAAHRRSGGLKVAEPLLQAYRNAAQLVSADCHLPVSLLAAIGQVESGNLRGRSLDARHRVVPRIRGPVLDGKPFARVPDTDGGVLDGDRRWDRAVGPMQFLPATWIAFAVDLDGDGRLDPQDVEDAAGSAAVYLCQSGGDLVRAGLGAHRRADLQPLPRLPPAGARLDGGVRRGRPDRGLRAGHAAGGPRRPGRRADGDPGHRCLRAPGGAGPHHDVEAARQGRGRGRPGGHQARQDRQGRRPRQARTGPGPPGQALDACPGGAGQPPTPSCRSACPTRSREAFSIRSRGCPSIPSRGSPSRPAGDRPAEHRATRHRPAVDRPVHGADAGTDPSRPRIRASRRWSPASRRLPATRCRRSTRPRRPTRATRSRPPAPPAHPDAVRTGAGGRVRK